MARTTHISSQLPRRFHGPYSSHWYNAVRLCLPALLILATSCDHNVLVQSVTTPRDICINNVRQIEAAKEDWARRTGATGGTEVTSNSITSFFTNGFPKCPEGGRYEIGRVGEPATCSDPKHQLPHE